MIDAHIELPQSEKSLGLLEDALEFSGVNEVIAVQRDACESVKQSCLKLAKQSDGLVRGVITHAPLSDTRKLRIQLDADRRESLIVGYVADFSDTHGIEDSNDQEVTHGVGLIEQSGKPLDVLLAPDQMRDIIPFLDAHPGLNMVLDHCVGSAISMDEEWQRALREIGRRPHVYYRLSGLATGVMGDTAYQITEATQAAFDSALSAFGPQRLLFGSNWPRNTIAYPVWLNTIDNLVTHLSEDERDSIYTSNAQEIYQIT
jgi:L-fuconolactonase